MPLEILPSIDLRGGKVVRLKQGDYNQQINYDADPVATAGDFREAGARWMHVVDLDGAKEGRPVQTDLIATLIKASGLQVECGGGIRSTDDIRRLLDAGATRVVVGTKALEDWPWFLDLLSRSEFDRKLVLAVDAKDGFVATRGWTETTQRKASDLAREVSGLPVGALLYTDVSKDGMLQGPNVAHTLALAKAGDVPVIASGGVGNIDHIRQIVNAPPIWGAIVGRSLYEGTLDLREAIRLARASL
jgi:phosphoribosylformimino-5-aminoimidazole carboxamide ribotide isomerase